MLDLRPVFFINGYLLLILAAAMGIPAAVDVLGEDADWKVFLVAAAATAFLGGGLVLANRPEPGWRLETRQAFLLSVSGWLVAAAAGSLPFLFSALKLSPIDALFEAMSGLTTTGATVISGLDQAPRGILLWRALLNWLGGGAILVMAVAILPFLRIGGMQLFRMETSDKTNKVRPRVAAVARSVGMAYGVLTALSGLAFWLAGMGRFDALCHALSALSTGGFSTSDASLAHWGGAVQWVAVVSMIVGGAPFAVFVAPWRQDRRSAIDDSQVMAYLHVLVSVTVVMAIWRWATSHWSLADSLRAAAFGVTSAATATGYVAFDITAWGGFAHVALFLLTFVGGCIGSTSGGIKIFRWQVLLALAEVHVKRLLHPHGVFPVLIDRHAVSKGVVDSVLAFVALYIATYALHAVALAATGLDVVTAVWASAAALGNAGGAMISTAGLSPLAKTILGFEMLVGRLELFTVFVLFTPAFWRE